MRHLLLSSAAVAALSLGFTAAPALAQVKVGVAGPLTGSNADFGTQLKTGADLAVSDINAAGGVLGQKLVEITADDACDPKQAVSAANTLVTDGVVMVDGHFCSSSSIPASAVYTDAGVLEITPASTNPKYTDAGTPFTFRTCGRDDQQGKVAAEYIYRHFPKARIAVLDDNSTYGKGIADQVRMNLAKLGFVVAYNASYTAGDKDYSALVSRMKQAGITLVYLGGLLCRYRVDRAPGCHAKFYATIFLGGCGGDAGFLDDRGAGRRGRAADLPAASRESLFRRQGRGGTEGAEGRPDRVRAVLICDDPGVGGGGEEGWQHERCQGGGGAEGGWALALRAGAD